MNKVTLYILALAIGGLAMGCGGETASSRQSGGDDLKCVPECPPSQRCTENGCVDKGPLCDPECGVDQTCTINGCVDNVITCNPACGSNQICTVDGCKDKVITCNPRCQPNQTCTANGCIDNEPEVDECGNSCIGDQECVEGTCAFTCAVHCGEKCCKEGQLCDSLTNRCTTACAENVPTCAGDCCLSSQTCMEEVGGCVENCGEEQRSCLGKGYGWCCASDELCVPEISGCTKDCGDHIKCQEICCADGEICLNGTLCRPDCSEEQTRCGETGEMCCDNDTQVCIFNQCLPRGKYCEDYLDCGLDEFCDPLSNTCVLNSEAPNVCEYHPPTGEFSPKMKWQYTEGKVENTPAVADLTGDGIPEVVFVNMNFQLVALDGRDGHKMATSTARTWNRYDGMAVANVDNEGTVEVIATTAEKTQNKSGMSILNLVEDGNGGWKWQEKAFIPIEDSQIVTQDSRYWVDIHPAIADIDSDGWPDIVTTRGIVKGNDLTKWKCKLWFPSYYAWYQYGFVIADLDQDGFSEIIGHRMYDHECNLLMEDPFMIEKGYSLSDMSNTSKASQGWGFTAVADLIDDENDENKPGEMKAEIVRVRSTNASSGAVSVWKVYKNDGVWTQERKWQLAHPGGGGGHPNIADFDGDKRAEIGIAGGSKYAVFKVGASEPLWSVDTNDSSSYRTGSSVFDFEGDGKAEVVYRDQCWLRIYDGQTGRRLWREKVTSGTVLDYPLIVDVDADGRTEIITTCTNYGNALKPENKDHGCGFDAYPPFGLIVFEDTWGNWVRTRKIWNQHTYHVTNINDDGSVPQHEEANWTKYNNYRQNVQPEGVFNAPDFVSDGLDSEKVSCDEIRLTAHVLNQGSFSARPGLPVNFYVVNPNNLDKTVLIGTANTSGSLPPSGSATAELLWNRKIKVDGEEVTVNMPVQVYYRVDEHTEEMPNGMYPECDEDNNQSGTFTVIGCGAN